jgi:hypothetical protein
MAVDLHSLLQDVAVVSFVEGNTVKNKTLAVQSLLEMTENRAKHCTIAGHSPSSFVTDRASTYSSFGIVLSKFCCKIEVFMNKHLSVYVGSSC